ncbi:MAG: hypothetical protein OHK0039_07060 [Bacteroidia bacterium]
MRLSNGRELQFDLDRNFLYEERDSDNYQFFPIDQVPAPITQYITQQYAGRTILSALRDDDGYEIFLDNGLELNFDLSGTFLYADDDDDGDDSDDYVAVPLDQVPAAIVQYVAQQYAGRTIQSAFRDDDGYEVFLDNGLELNFDLSGTFLYAG